jgi:hypothetical protein
MGAANRGAERRYFVLTISLAFSQFSMVQRLTTAWHIMLGRTIEFQTNEAERDRLKNMIRQAKSTTELQDAMQKASDYLKKTKYIRGK